MKVGESYMLSIEPRGECVDMQILPQMNCVDANSATDKLIALALPNQLLLHNSVAQRVARALKIA